jgi:hypothetical protein
LIKELFVWNRFLLRKSLFLGFYARTSLLNFCTQTTISMKLLPFRPGYPGLSFS